MEPALPLPPPDIPLPDELLARRTADGHTDCFAELVRRYRARVYRICYGMAGSAEDAEDWAQECFVRAYRQLRAYDSARPFAPWFLRVVSNMSLNLARARGARASHTDLRAVEEMPDSDRAADPLGAALAGEDAGRVRAAVEALAPPLRQAVVLRVVEGLSFRELADALGVPLQTAASRVRRGLAEVRQALEETGNEVSR